MKHRPPVHHTSGTVKLSTHVFHIPTWYFCRCLAKIVLLFALLMLAACSETSPQANDMVLSEVSDSKDGVALDVHDTLPGIIDTGAADAVVAAPDVVSDEFQADLTINQDSTEDVALDMYTGTDVAPTVSDTIELVDTIIAAPCRTNGDCDDGNQCTLDRCMTTHECIWQYIWCDDDSPCTLDGCEPATGCTFLKVNCTDTNPCEVSTCSESTGQCVAKAIDCNDQNPCTLDSCVSSSGCYYEQNPATPCCKTDDECPQTPCTQGVCLSGTCSTFANALPDCCMPIIAEESFDDGVADGFVWSDTQNPVKWSIYPGGIHSPSPCLYFGNPTTLNYQGGPWEDTILSPEIVLPAEAESTLRFDLNMATESSAAFDVLTVHAIDQTGTSHTIWTKKHDLSETFSWNSHDIDLTPLSGTKIRIKWTFSSLDTNSNMGFGVFLDNIKLTSTCDKMPCPSGGKCLSDVPAFIGFCVSDNCVFSPNTDTCTTDSDCNVLSQCTNMICVDGYCAQSPIDGCCVTATDCVDGDPCTEDICLLSTGQCAHPSSWLCCYVDADCDDGNPCTNDSCPTPLSPCNHTPVLDCCLSAATCQNPEECIEWSCSLNQCVKQFTCCDADAQCDDGESCSTDTCIDGQCNYVPADPAFPCCSPLIIQEKFTVLDFDAWKTVTDSAPNDDISWHITTQTYLSAPGALALASPTTDTYDAPIPVHVVLESLQMAIPPKAVLSFWFYLSNEFSNATSAAINYDVLSVIVWDGTQQKTVWSSGQPNSPWWAVGGLGGIAGPVWSHVGGVSLAPYAGKSISIRLSFESFDSANNHFFGPVIDDLKIEAPCPK